MLDARSNTHILGNKGPLRVIISIITGWSFLFYPFSCDVAWAARAPSGLTSVGPDRAGGPGSSMAEFEIDDLSIPLSLGGIRDKFTGTIGKTIIHIQDAHCDYSAQHSIAGIVESLANNYQIELVLLEGGRGDYDLSIFTRIKDPDIRERVSDCFVREGLVNGPEFFAINNPDKVRLFGIEDERLYMENLNAYRDSLAFKGEADRYLHAIAVVIDNLKAKVYSAELRELDDTITKYKDNKIGLKEYALYLRKKSGQCQISLERYKNIDSLLALLKDERAIDFREAKKERAVLSDRLGSRLSKKDIEDLTIKTSQFKSGNITAEDFYGFLFDRARFASVDFSMLPNLVKYSEYMKRYESLNTVYLYKELIEIEESLIKILAKTDDEKALRALDKRASIMMGMFNISLLKGDFDYYNAHKEEFAIKNFTDFFDKKCPAYGLSFKMDEGIARMDLYRDHMERFYRYSLERDEAFIKNIEAELNSGQKDAAILVTGGFHTGNLSNLLKAKGYSYVEVMPRFKSEEGENPYFKLLSDERTAIDEFLIKAITYTPQKASIAIWSLSSPTRVNEIVRNISALRANILEEVFKEKTFTIQTRHGYIVVSKEEVGRPLVSFNIDYQGRPLVANIFLELPTGFSVNAVVLEEKNMSWNPTTGIVEEGKAPQTPKAEEEKRRLLPTYAQTVTVFRGIVEVGRGRAYAEGRLLKDGEGEGAKAAVGEPLQKTFYKKFSIEQVYFEAPGLARAASDTQLDGFAESMAHSEIAILKGVDPLKEKRVMLNIGYSEGMSIEKIVDMVSFQLRQAVLKQVNADERTSLDNVIQRFEIGNVTLNIFLDTPDNRKKLVDDINEFAKENNIKKKTERIVTFAYQKPELGLGTDKDLEKNSYTVYMDGKEGDTYAPPMTCGATGLAILNYYALKERAASPDQINYALELIARGMGALSGVSEYKDIIGVITERDAAGRLQLLKSGLILVKIRPMDTNKIWELEERSKMVRRAA